MEWSLPSSTPKRLAAVFFPEPPRAGRADARVPAPGRIYGRGVAANRNAQDCARLAAANAASRVHRETATEHPAARFPFTSVERAPGSAGSVVSMYTGPVVDCDIHHD